MLLRGLLLKIETGQSITEKQEKKLASKLFLVPSIMRTFIKVVLVISIVSLVLLAYTNSVKNVNAVFLYIGSLLLALFYIYVLILPKNKNIMRYLEAVEQFYETKFDGLDGFDLYYIGQHKSPHVRSLRSSKIYLLTNGYNLLFVDDYFKDTTYKLPNYLSNGTEVSLRVIDPLKTDESRLMLSVGDVDNFRLSNDDFPIEKKNVRKKYERYFKYFLDQNQYMTDRHYVTLKLNSGAVFRLSYKSYEALKNAIPLKENKS